MRKRKSAPKGAQQLVVAHRLYQKNCIRLVLIKTETFFSHYYRPSLEWLNHKIPTALRFLRGGGES